jgi:DNA mismatch repair protein MutS
MRQYHEQKQQAGDAVLLFRMGDFYEMFYDDAELGARVLGIALTSRDGGRTPLAGIPHHALEGYLAKLVAAGLKVAISEQIEDARQAKGVVRRAIVRIVTPGTLTDDALLDRTRRNVLVAVHEGPAEVGLASLELSTGQFDVQLCPSDRVLDELGRLAPAEILLPESATPGPHPLEADLRERLGVAVTYRNAADFTTRRAEQLLREHFETATLEGFGFTHTDASLQAAAALLAYIRETQRLTAQHIHPPRRRSLAEHMVLDPTTLRSLEIERTLRTGSRSGALLGTVDRTCNPMGARLLREWLCYPLRNIERIRARQDCVAALRIDDAGRTAIRRALREMSDLDRIVGRLGVQRINPRDLRALGDALARLATFRDTLHTLHIPLADAAAEQLAGLDSVANGLCTALAPEAPTTVREGGIFAAGHHAELDRLRAFGREGQQWLADFQARESQRTGVPSLKVAFNKVFGFYIEITNTHRDRVPPDYVRKQTVKNAERYITDELKHYESEALSAESRANELEYDLFITLRDATAEHIPALQRAASALAEIDVLAGWAELAREQAATCPEFVSEPILEIDAGRHPVVAAALGPAFVVNDTQLTAGGRSLALITGPNMAGKSTYIRQVALLALLAHCGCWVPAQRMRLGLIDRIFTRVGASDELARGQSTFMVEMLETANILHNATSASLVILDEVGRGTSTFDGVSLAWAITEHLATRCGCRTLFATHYHELTELADLLEPVFNLNVAVREYEDQVVFLHRIVPGGADRSYGLHVAKLAGLPRSVLERANAVLSELEKTFSRESQRPALAAVQRRRHRQLRLFEEPEEIIVRQLRELPPEAPAPEAALDLIRRWRELLDLPAARERNGP